MSSVYAISSNFIKKTIPFYALSSISIMIKPLSLLQTFNSLSFKKIKPDNQKNFVHATSAKMSVTGPDELPAKSPPEIPTAPPFHKPGIPPEAPRRPNNVPDFDEIPPEKPADLPPISPGPNPEFPGPGNPSPPGQPEVVPPHGPDVIPPKPTEPGEGVPQPKPEIELPNGPDFIPPKPPGPGFPQPTQPEIPPPIIM